MQIRKSDVISSVATWTVHVEPNEVVADSGKAYPFATCIGTVNAHGVIKVWTPVAYKPRGYVAAARRVLETALTRLRDTGVIPRERGYFARHRYTIKIVDGAAVIIRRGGDVVGTGHGRTVAESFRVARSDLRRRQAVGTWPYPEPVR